MIISPEYKDVSDENRHRSVTPQELGLTPRQGEILNLVLQGMSNKKVAQILSLSESTVKEHMTGILERMGVTRRVEIFHLLNVNGWVFAPHAGATC
jgi:DNA-binding CsgD family transcriptional regulator